LIDDKYIKGFLLLISKNYTVSFLSFINVILLAKFLSLELFGKIQFFITVFYFLQIFTLNGVGAFLTIESAKKRYNYFSQLIHLKKRLAIVPSIILFFIGLGYFINDDPQLGYTFVSASFIFVLSIYTVITNVYIATLRIKALFKVDFMLKLTVMVFIILGIFFNIDSVSYYALIPIVLSGIAYYFLSKNEILHSFQQSNERVYKKIKKFIYKKSLINILPMIDAKLDRLIIGLFFSFEQLAVYSIAKYLMEQIKVAVMSFLNIIIPKFSTMDENKINNEIVKYILLELLIIGCLVTVVDIVVIYCIQEYFVKYSDSIIYIHILLFSIILSIPGNVLQAKIIAKKNLKVELLYSIYIPIFYIISLILLSYLYGTIGIAYAVILKSLFLSVITYILSKKG
jgi:O-antigen/teichoic acid export membrane protein